MAVRLLAFPFFCTLDRSSRVQVAVLTVRIDALREHVKRHRKDHSSKRGLEALTNQRKKVLRYLRRKDFEAFRAIVKELDIGSAVRSLQ